MSVLKFECLQERFIPFAEFKEWKKADKRYPEQALQKFLSQNKRTFDFLDIKAEIAETSAIGINFTTGKFVGCAPLRNPFSGVPYQDLVITSRFGEDVVELANLLQETIEPEFGEQEITPSNLTKAPIYLDCINYFNVFLKATQCAWNKFEVVRKIEDVPTSSTDWKRYAERSYDPHNTLKFSNRKSIQSKNHREWYELTYIANYALKLFRSPVTPASTKWKVKTVTDRIEAYIRKHTSVPTERLFKISPLDPAVIKELKKLANILIDRNINNRLEWRIDSSELFERYVQYIMGQVANRLGGRSLSNSKFSITGERPSWCLKYLEPDILLETPTSLIAIDAKYKSHMFNTSTSTDVLKDTFRHDLHQVLAYSAFDNASEKTSMLVYPQDRFICKTLNIRGGLSRVDHRVLLVGISFNTKELDNTVSNLCEVIQSQ